MTSSESAVRMAFERASRTQEELDKRVFQLKILYETACELSGFNQPRKIMETGLLTAMGILGITRGLVILINTRTFKGHIAHRGLTGLEVESCESNLANIAQHYLPDKDLKHYAEVVTDSMELFPSETALVIKQMLDEDYAVLAAFGRRLSGHRFEDSDITALLNLTGTISNVLSQNLFNRQVQHLNAGLLRQSSELQNALDQVGQARKILDRKIFHLQTLYELNSELSPIIATKQLLEAYLLMLMGSFGVSQGVVLLCDRKSRKVCCVSRGSPEGREWTIEGSERILYRGFQATEERRLDPMSVSIIVDPQPVFLETDFGFNVHTAAMFTVDDSMLGMVALGTPLGKLALEAEELLLLRGLTANCMVFLNNARAFETIQTLNEDLSRSNVNLRKTIADLTEARHQIRILELAKNRFKQLVHKEIERVGRFRPSDVILMIIIATFLALTFNYSSPNGIPILPESAFQPLTPHVDVLTAHQLVSNAEAVLVDARPPELFTQKHIQEAINIPAALFDIIYPMKLGRILKPDQVVLVYGRTISRRYDEDVAQRLLQRHDLVKVIEGGIVSWEQKGLPVSP